MGEDIRYAVTEKISWSNLYDTFGANGNQPMDKEAQRIYEDIKGVCYKVNLIISARVDKAIRDYCSTASVNMKEDEYNNSTGIIALDYAVLQKILPKIIGSGDQYHDWLQEFLSCCQNNNLMKSAEEIQRIIDNGDRKMKYYQFFE